MSTKNSKTEQPCTLHSVNGSYSPAQMIEIEPGLKMSEDLVKRENERARHKIIYWHNVWASAKKLHYYYVGFMAQEEKLNSMKCWDIWHDYLKSLAVNCR